jgi:hypothetical protein
MSHLYCYIQKDVHLLYIHTRNWWACTVTVKCVEVLTVVFVSLCHEQLDHFHEEEEKDSNRYRVLVHMRHLLYPQSTGTSKWKDGHYQNSGCCKIWTWLPLALLSRPTVAAAPSSCPMSLLDEIASSLSHSKISSCSVSFQFLKKLCHYDIEKLILWWEKILLLHKYHAWWPTFYLPFCLPLPAAIVASLLSFYIILASIFLIYRQISCCVQSNASFLLNKSLASNTPATPRGSNLTVFILLFSS